MTNVKMTAVKDNTYYVNYISFKKNIPQKFISCFYEYKQTLILFKASFNAMQRKKYLKSNSMLRKIFKIHNKGLETDTIHYLVHLPLREDPFTHKQTIYNVYSAILC